MRYSIAKILYALFLKSTVFSNLYALRCPPELKGDFVSEDKGPIFGHLKEIVQVMLELHLKEAKDPREKHVKLKQR